MANREKASAAPLVLIANDQEWSARSLESILGPNGYSVVRAYTGQQALERARTSQPDIIILDAQMPDMHGFEVCRSLRSDPRFSATTPIVITTSGPSGTHPASRGLPLRRLGIPRAAARRRGAAAQAGHVPRSRSGRSTSCARRICSTRAPGSTTCAGLARRAREIGADATPPPRGARLRGVRARDGARRATRSPPATRWRGCRIRSARCSGEAGRVSDAIGRLGATEFAVIAPATGADGALRLVNRLGGAVEATRIPVRGGERSVRVKAGYCAVPDFADVRGGCHGTPASCNDRTSGSQAGGRRRPHPGLRAGVPAVPHLARTSL